MTFFYDGLQPGQQWTVTFQQGSTTVSTRGFVVLQRALTDPTGQTRQLQLVATVPTEAALGPTRILASTPTASFMVTEDSFTVVGKTLSVSELEIEYDVNDYRTAVGSDGALYIGVGGLDVVCKAMAFSATIMRMTPGGQLQADKVVVFNSQGYLLDDSVNGADHFSFGSNEMSYWRHSFDTYCVNHQFGGIQEIDPGDHNWHLDGTPHIDYSTLLFAIAGHSADGSTLPAGEVLFDIRLQSAPASSMPEGPEERVRR